MLNLLAAVCLSVAPYGASASQPTLWGSLEPGRHPVGVRVVSHSGTHPVRIVVWYPAAPRVPTRSVTLSDYVRLAQEATRGETSPAALRTALSVAMSADPAGVAEPTLDRLLSTPMSATRDARTARGRYPLVLWGSRHATMLAQSVMSEYLASHGFVVAYAYPAGAPRKLPYEVEAREAKVEILRSNVADLETALAELRRAPNVDGREVAIVTWSYAGESATLFQTWNAEVDLVIGLSSNVLEGWVYQDPEALAKLSPASLRAPYVLMTEKVGTNGNEKLPPRLLDEAPAGGYFVTFPKLAHGNFNAIEGLIPALAGVDRVPRWSKAGPDARIGYETVARFVLHFLDARLRAHSPDLVKGWDWKRGLPEGFATVETRGRVAPR
jgi:hypothetical protein